MTENPVDITKLETPIVAIVAFASQLAAAEKMPGFSVPFYQVTVDPKAISSTGDFIRFGEVPGDEITGWKAVGEIVVCETLGEHPAPKRFTSVQGMRVLERVNVGAPSVQVELVPVDPRAPAMSVGDKVMLRRNGGTVECEVLNDCGEGMRDLLVPEPDGDGANPHRLNSVPACYPNNLEAKVCWFV